MSWQLPPRRAADSADFFHIYGQCAAPLAARYSATYSPLQYRRDELGLAMLFGPIWIFRVHYTPRAGRILHDIRNAGYTRAIITLL